MAVTTTVGWHTVVAACLTTGRASLPSVTLCKRNRGWVLPSSLPLVATHLRVPGVFIYNDEMDMMGRLTNTASTTTTATDSFSSS